MPDLPNPFLVKPALPPRSPSPLASSRFALNVAAFMAALEPAPAFLSAPRPEYLRDLPGSAPLAS